MRPKVEEIPRYTQDRIVCAERLNPAQITSKLAPFQPKNSQQWI